MATPHLNVQLEDGLDVEGLVADVGGGVRVLHIDDEGSFAEVVAEFLQQEADYFEVLTETDPREGIERAREGDVDCVVSDYEMPGLDGLEVLQAVRESDPTLPFVLFTGRGSEEIASEAISRGVTDYLQKGGGTEQYQVLANRIEQAVARRRAEQQVELGFQAIEAAHEGISLLNEDGEFIYVNEPYAEIVGYERDELLGSHFETLYPESELEQAYEEIIPAAKTGGWSGRTVCLTRSGEQVTVEHVVSYTSEGTMICTISETEKAVREQLSLRERAMDEAPIGITISDPHQDDNPIVYTNEGFIELTGYTKDETRGWNHRFLQGEETREEPVAEMRQAIDAAEPVSVELRNYRKDGTEFWNRVTIAPLFDDEGTLEYFVGFQEDVTDRREVIEEYRSLGEVVSHDLHNPLRTIRGRIRLAIQREDISHVEEAIQAVDRLEELIDDVANVLKFGRIAEEREPIDVGSVAESVWTSLEKGHENDSIVVVGSPEVTGDEEAVRRMLDNILANSLVHGESPVQVRVGESDDGFYVADDGPGIPEEIRERVFEHGFSTKDDDVGTGLGMTSVRQIAQAHDWKIAIEDAEESGGVRFEIRTK